MKRLLLSVWLLSLTLLSAVAENYPYRSDVLWVTVPNHSDWFYKTGEKATVEVQLYKYGIPKDNGGYPHFFRNSVDMDTPEKIKTMAYYDVVNFAKLTKADTYMTWGFNDDVCPPTTSYIYTMY